MSQYAQNLALGTSTSFFGPIREEDWKWLSKNGVHCVELSYRYEYYMEEIDFPHRAEEYAAMAQRAGIVIRSIHLPFSRVWDISSEDDGVREEILRANRLLIEAAGRIGVRTAVLHPSSEPIAEEMRERRLQRSREGILRLCETAKKTGVVLAVENLPRTCLCRTAEEMIRLLRGTGASVAFDTNHNLLQDSVSFLQELYAAGLTVATLHISDYDGTDERHRLPGLGINDWQAILKTLEQGGYVGPLMYEVSASDRHNDPAYAVTPQMLVQNMRWLVTQ